MKGEKKKLGEILVDAGLVSKQQIEEALRVQKETGERLGKVLVRLNLINEEALISFLGEQLGIPHVDLKDYLVDPDTINLVPEFVARKHQLVPLFKIGDTLTVAMVDPLNVFAIDEVSLKAGCTVEPALAMESDIKRAIDQYYGVTGTMDEVIKKIEEEQGELLGTGEHDIENKKLAELAEEAPVIKLVNILILNAIRDGASDIHIEPEENMLRIRYRIDGVMQEVPPPPKNLQAAVISRLKIMSEMDIAEKRVPQDGRFRIKVENRQVDMRVSTLPTIHGENVVMRILDVSKALLGLEQLGFAPDVLEEYNKTIRKSYGIVLVTGPTGSGKTTTLYSSLNVINTVDKNIITVEDPVEYRLKLIRQAQVNVKAGLTFASGLRAILRQDPDIVMVGEIRDVETAEIAIQAALTGHLVFSTLHTNNAPGAATRLVDMGVEPFLVSSSILAIIGQRLVRKICPSCKEEYQPPEALLLQAGLDPKQKDLKVYHGKGCKTCLNTGYKGRICIFELLLPNDKIRSLIVQKTSMDVIRKEAVIAGMKTMRDDGLLKVRQGVTTVEEVIRATQED